MNETLKKNLKRSLAAFLAVVLVAMPSISGAADLEEAETAPATEIINEAAEAPAAPEAEVPEVLPDSKSSETNKAADKADFDVEKAYEEYLSFKEEEQREEYLNSISAKNREELEKYIADKEAEANAKDAALAAFAAKVEAAGKITDIEEAYEHYLSLAEEWQKEQYLNSLSAEDRATLKQYIADKEAEAALAELAAEPETAIDENAEEAPAEEAAEENAEATEATEATEEPEVTEETEEPPAEEPAEEAEDAEEPEGEPAEEPEEEPEEEPTEEPEEEPAEEPEEDPDRVISFGSAHIEGEWAGRDTKAIRTLTIHVYIDGALAGTCSTAANKSVAFFAVYAGDNEITDVTANSWAVTSSGTAWCVDMYEDHNVMVDVNLSSLPAEEAEEAENTEPAEEVTEETEDTEFAEEAIEEAEETEPTEEITEETEDTEPAEEVTEETEETEPAEEAAEEAESEEPTEEITEETEKLTEEEGNSALTEEIPEDAVLLDTLKDKLDPDRRIDIYASWEGEQVENGTEVTLTAILYGYDNAVYTLRWQKAESATEEIPEESWTDLEGMTESTMTFVFSEDSADDYYRIVVNITDVTDITDTNEAAPEEMLSTQ